MDPAWIYKWLTAVKIMVTKKKPMERNTESDQMMATCREQHRAFRGLGF